MGKKKKSGKSSWWDEFNFTSEGKSSSKDETLGEPAPKKKSYYDTYYDEMQDDYQPYGGDYYGGGTRYYNYGYSRTYERKSTTPSWSWGSYGGYKGIEDEDDDIYVKAHESYLTPTNADIKWRLDYQSDTEKNRLLIKEMSRFFYHKMLDDDKYMDPKYEVTQGLTETQITEFQGKQVFYKDLWDKYIPGITPLEQAINTFNDIQEKKKGKGGADIGKADLTTEDLRQNVNDIEFHEELYCDPTFNELMKMQPLADKHKMDIFRKLSMISHLGGEFKVQKETEERIVQNSSVISKKIMRDFSQVHNIDLYQRLMPTFPTKLVTKDLIVNVCVDKSDHKQKIIVLLDFSGSMHQDEKQIWVLAIMMDRLKYAMLEEAEIFFSYFVHRTEELKFTHIYDRKTALEFWSKFSTRPNGGDTRLGDMVTHIGSEIKAGKLHNLNVDLSKEMPEILAISDGQDTCKVSKGQFDYKTNAVTLVDGKNKELQDLCVANHGKYVYITTGGEITTYSKDGIFSGDGKQVKG